MPETPFFVQEYPNGLVLIGEPMSGVRSAAFSFLVPAGAVHEPLDRLGMAGMLAEWIMRGAGDRDSRKLIGDLDDLGVNHGESAQTFHTSISAATLGANLAEALAIYADVLLRPRLEDDELEPIRALCVQSLQSLEDDPGSKVIHELRKRHFPDPLGRSAVGDLKGVESAAPEEVRSYFRAHFKPNGSILAVAGAIDWPRLRDCVGEWFGAWKRTDDQPFTQKPSGPRRDHILRETNQIQIALAFPSVPPASPEYYQARAATGILGGYSSARLFTEVREKRGLCYSVGAGYEATKTLAAILCHAGTTAERAQETLDVTWTELGKLFDQGALGDELDIMRAGLKSSLVMQQESTMSRAGALAADWYHLARPRTLEEITGALDALTPQSINTYLAAHKPGPDQTTILTLGPKPLDFPD